MGSRKIYGRKQQSEMYRRTLNRDELVNKYGESTVLRAEISVILNLLMITKIIHPSEFVDAMVSQCERIEDERRKEARLEADRG